MAQWLESMSTRSRVLLGVGIGLIVISTLVFGWWASRTEHAVLFSRLTEASLFNPTTSLTHPARAWRSRDTWPGCSR